MSNTADAQNADNGTASKPLPQYAIITALVIVVGFGALCWYTLVNSEKTGAPWDHLIVVFNAVQTFAAAAAGVLLGTTIQAKSVSDAQAQTADAKQKAAAEKEKADANSEAALKLKAAKKILDNSNPPGGNSPPDHPTVRALAAVLS